MTTKMWAEIVRLNKEEDLCDAEIARRLGVKACVVTRWREKLHLPVGKKGKQNRKLYTFYDRKSTEFLCEGTAEECAQMLGLSVKSMHSVISRCKSGKTKKYEVFEVESK